MTLKIRRLAAAPALGLAAALALSACGGGHPNTWQQEYAPVRADVVRVQHDLATGQISDLYDAGDQLAGDATIAQGDVINSDATAPRGRAGTLFMAALGHYANAGNLLSPGWSWDAQEVGQAQADLARGNTEMARVRVLLKG